LSQRSKERGREERRCESFSSTGHCPSLITKCRKVQISKRPNHSFKSEWKLFLDVLNLGSCLVIALQGGEIKGVMMSYLINRTSRILKEKLT
jgi:hypothetical protein